MLDLSPDFRQGQRRSRVLMTAFMLAVIMLGIVVALDALAHHPGSHARSLGNGMVRLDAVVMVPDACTAIEGIEPGAPTGLSGAKDAAPVRAILKRPADAICAQVVKAERASRDLSVPATTRFLHFFVVGANGGVMSTERVKID